MHPRSSPRLEGDRDSHAIESGEGVEGGDSSRLIQLLEPTTGGIFSSLSLLSSDEESGVKGGGTGMTLV